MTTEEIIRELNCVLKKNEGKVYDTCEINYNSLVSDVIKHITKLDNELNLVSEK